MEETSSKTSENQSMEELAGKGLSRRRFFKAGALGATIGAASLVGNKKAMATEAAKATQASLTKEHEDFPVKMLDSYKRFPQKKSILSQSLGRLDPVLAEQGWEFELQTPRPEAGYTLLERALTKAAWSVHDSFSPNSAPGVPNSQAFAWDLPVHEEKYQFKNKKEASKYIKRAAKQFGASLVGITPHDERWVYDPLYNAVEGKEIPAKFPFKPKSVIVMAIEMDYEAISTSPSWISCGGTGKAYSDMSVLAHTVSAFVRELGYKAFGSGNDVALSVPLAIAAGLGELSRMGSVVTYEYGPRVRLCKVFTELELEYDKPKTFGVQEFCERCMRCADACPSKAIPRDRKPSSSPPPNLTTCNPGVEKWYSDGAKCFKFWGENGHDCANCITACVYNKPDLWHHKMIVWATRAAPGPLHSFMREMDIVFGYGNTYDKKAIKQWWDK